MALRLQPWRAVTGTDLCSIIYLALWLPCVRSMRIYAVSRRCHARCICQGFIPRCRGGACRAACPAFCCSLCEGTFLFPVP